MLKGVQVVRRETVGVECWLLAAEPVLYVLPVVVASMVYAASPTCVSLRRLLKVTAWGIHRHIFPAIVVSSYIW